MALPDPVMSEAELEEFLAKAFPFADQSLMAKATKLETGYLKLKQPFHETQLRPGGTISGPTMMSLADKAMYLLVVAHIGPEPMAVTSSLVMNFLNRADPVDLIAESRLLKLGRSLAVGDVQIRATGSDKIAAQATVTYSLARTSQNSGK